MMRWPFLFLVATQLAGCASAMKAVGSCAYKAGQKNSAGDWRYAYEPSAACSFNLESPINKAQDAERFAGAFSTMFKVMPRVDGAEYVQPKLEVKVETK